MKKQLLILLSIILTQAIFAQSKVFRLKKAGSNSFEMTTSSKSADILEISTNLSFVKSALKSTKIGNFIELVSDGLVKTYDLGKPDIPIFSKLIELPLEASVQFKIISYDEEIIDLNANGIHQKIIPAQPSIFKTPKTEKFYYDKKTYKEDNYLNTKIADFEEIGILRSARLGRVIVHPVQYNPVQNKLRILNNLKLEIAYIGSNHARTRELKTKYSSTPFNNIISAYTPNSTIKTKQLITDTITYVIIADMMFKSALAPFIAHKQSLGYKVIVAYTDSIGTTTTSIKAYLQGLYNNPPSGYAPPHYVLLVGDVAQIPSFPSNFAAINDHVTDLYYFDYTGDNIPDVFYGRFSATNAAQLAPQITKTIEYESTSLSDTTYLYKAVLIAGGNGGQYSLVNANGMVNYGANLYFNSVNGITAYKYFQNEPSGGNYSARIISNINNGAGFVIYSGHSNSGGWAFPSFYKGSITTLTNANKYGLWVGNCCRTNRFSETECFGEAALRASNKGAVGYIGATDYTTWDEDYWWEVGYKTASANPGYDTAHLGMFDRLFHTHGESTNKWYSTQGQLVVSGNLAVQESSSSLKLYYWEIYELLGDPSLNIKFVPAASSVGNITISENTSSMPENVNSYDTINQNKLFDNISEEPFIHIYPNPASNGQFTIKVSNQNSVPISITIYNSLGALLYKKHNLTETTSISNINAKGVIFIKFNFPDKYVIRKLILE